MHVDLYSDGSSRGNPGPGGYGCILRAVDGAGKVHEKEFTCGYEQTTNNRMELLGVITGLEALNRPSEVTVHTDSQYVVKAYKENWLKGWVARGWKTASKQPVKNVDLWKRLMALTEIHTVDWHWIKGHNGHPENERCDALATTAADGSNLQIDEGFLAEG